MIHESIDARAVKLGYVILHRLDRRCIRKDEKRIDALNASILDACIKRKRLLGQFNVTVQNENNNVAARLNRQLCTLDSIVESLVLRVQSLNDVESRTVKTVKDPFYKVSTKIGRKHKSNKVTRFVSEREEGKVCVIKVIGTPSHHESVPSYMGGVTPPVYGQYIGTCSIVAGMTGFNEIAPFYSKA